MANLSPTSARSRYVGVDSAKVIDALGGAVRGALAVPEAIKTEGPSGLLRAFVNPEKYDTSRENTRDTYGLAQQSYKERMAIRQLVDSGQGEEAFIHAKTLYETLSHANPNVPDELVRRAVAPEMQMAVGALTKPSAQGTPQEAARLSGFLSQKPKDVLAAAKGQADIGQSEATGGYYNAKAGTEKMLQPGAVEAQGARTGYNRALASYYNRSAGAGMGSATPAKTEDQLRDDLRMVEIELSRQVGEKGTIAGAEPLLDEANRIRTRLGMPAVNVNDVLVKPGTPAKAGFLGFGGSPAVPEVRENRLQVQAPQVIGPEQPAAPTTEAPQAAAPTPATGFGETARNALSTVGNVLSYVNPAKQDEAVQALVRRVQQGPEPPPGSMSTPEVNQSQVNPFADLEQAALSGHVVQAKASQLRQRLIAAGILDKAQQDAMIQAFLQRVNAPRQ